MSEFERTGKTTLDDATGGKLNVLKDRLLSVGKNGNEASGGGLPETPTSSTEAQKQEQLVKKEEGVTTKLPQELLSQEGRSILIRNVIRQKDLLLQEFEASGLRHGDIKEWRRFYTLSQQIPGNILSFRDSEGKTKIREKIGKKITSKLVEFDGLERELRQKIQSTPKPTPQEVVNGAPEESHGGAVAEPKKRGISEIQNNRLKSDVWDERPSIHNRGGDDEQYERTMSRYRAAENPRVAEIDHLLGERNKELRELNQTMQDKKGSILGAIVADEVLQSDDLNKKKELERAIERLSNERRKILAGDKGNREKENPLDEINHLINEKRKALIEINRRIQNPDDSLSKIINRGEVERDLIREGDQLKREILELEERKGEIQQPKVESPEAKTESWQPEESVPEVIDNAVWGEITNGKPIPGDILKEIARKIDSKAILSARENLILIRKRSSDGVTVVPQVGGEGIVSFTTKHEEDPHTEERDIDKKKEKVKDEKLSNEEIDTRLKKTPLPYKGNFPNREEIRTLQNQIYGNKDKDVQRIVLKLVNEIRHSDSDEPININNPPLPVESVAKDYYSKILQQFPTPKDLDDYFERQQEKLQLELAELEKIPDEGNKPTNNLRKMAINFELEFFGEAIEDKRGKKKNGYKDAIEEFKRILYGERNTKWNEIKELQAESGGEVKVEAEIDGGVVPEDVPQPLEADVSREHINNKQELYQNGDISDKIWKKFVEDGSISTDVLDIIVDKIIQKKEKLTEKETSIFSNNAPYIEAKLAEQQRGSNREQPPGSGNEPKGEFLRERAKEGDGDNEQTISFDKVARETPVHILKAMVGRTNGGSIENLRRIEQKAMDYVDQQIDRMKGKTIVLNLENNRRITEATNEIKKLKPLFGIRSKNKTEIGKLEKECRKLKLAIEKNNVELEFNGFLMEVEWRDGLLKKHRKNIPKEDLAEGERLLGDAREGLEKAKIRLNTLETNLKK